MKTKEFLNQLQHPDIVAAIREAELKTSGEIRVFISHKPVEDAVTAAQAQFQRLGMTKTQQRNGVLVFVAPETRKFAVVGDTGVNEKCGEGFWRELAAEMTGHFKQSEFTLGIVQGVRKAGQMLALHFPHAPANPNELSDEVEHG
jgi:uncharacterized membrane protein